VYAYQASNYGDYYAGDPGIFGWLAKKALGVAKVIPGVSGIAGTAERILFPGAAPPQMPPMGTPPIIRAPLPMAPGGQLPAVPVPGTKGAIQRILPGGASGYMSQGIPAGYHLNKAPNRVTGQPAGSYLVRNRSMNPGNARALRRAVRREGAFVSLAKRTLRGSGYTFKKTGVPGGRRRKR
jgi:hypothetical protein